MQKLQVFISYHEDDTGAHAAQLKQDIERGLRADAYVAHRDGTAGYWPSQIVERLYRADVFVMLIGPKWTQYVNGPGHDWVRTEATFALAMGNKEYISIAIETNAPSRETFPEPIQQLCSYNFSSLENIVDDLRSFPHRSSNGKPVVYLSSATCAIDHTGPLDYFAMVASELAIQLNSQDLDVVLKVPEAKSIRQIALNQQDLLKKLLRERTKYSAIVVAPYSTTHIGSLIVELQRVRPRIPVLTIDKGYRPQEVQLVQEFADTPSPPGVMANWKQGGGLAARLLTAHFDALGIHAPKVVIVSGLEGSADRVEGFTSEFEARYARAGGTIIDHIKCDFQRKLAKRQTLRFFKSYQHSPGRLHAFFCCNDEMALGVRDALIELSDYHFNDDDPGTNLYRGIKIVGFDGIRDVSPYLKHGRADGSDGHPDKFLLNTIDVRVSEQVDKLIELLREQLNGHEAAVGPETIDCEEYIDEELQRRRSATEESHLQRHCPKMLKAIRC